MTFVSAAHGELQPPLELHAIMCPVARGATLRDTDKGCCGVCRCCTCGAAWPQLKQHTLQAQSPPVAATTGPEDCCAPCRCCACEAAWPARMLPRCWRMGTCCWLWTDARSPTFPMWSSASPAMRRLPTPRATSQAKRRQLALTAASQTALRSTSWRSWMAAA